MTKQSDVERHGMALIAREEPRESWSRPVGSRPVGCGRPGGHHIRSDRDAAPVVFDLLDVGWMTVGSTVASLLFAADVVMRLSRPIVVGGRPGR